MIVSFRDQGSEDVFHGVNSRDARKRISRDVWAVGGRKLDLLNAAHDIRDLMVPPGNRLEKLEGSLKDFHGIRINDQFRIIFRWVEGNAKDVKIDDYHSLDPRFLREGQA